MPNKSNYSLITGGMVVCFLLVGVAFRGHAIASQQVSQERSLEAQLRELSTQVSKSSGIEQNFERHVSSDGSIIVVSNNPETFVHVFVLGPSKGFYFEMRELKEVAFLADYQPCDAPAVRIPNPIKDPARYALVALRKTFLHQKRIDDLTDLVPIAEQTLTPKGYLHRAEPGTAISPRSEVADYVGLRYLILDRQSLRDKQGNLSFIPFADAYGVCLYIVENGNEVNIQYEEWPSGSTTCLTQYLVKRVSRQDLLSQVYRRSLVHHDWTSTYRNRVRGINRMFGRRKYIDLMLYAQALRFEGGIWRVFDQEYVVYNSSNKTLVSFERIEGRMVVTEVT